jgi:hypothetical protein
MSEHLDLDALADVLADGHEPPHLANCPACRARLSELRGALPAVSAALSAVPLPELPAGLADRLASAIAGAAEPASTNVLPMARRRTRWLPALAAVAATAVVATGAVVLFRHGSPSTGTQASAPGYRVNSSGTDYTAQTLPAALPGLLAGTAPAEHKMAAAPSAPGTRASDTTFGALAPDPLAELRTTAGLARCLASLTDPSEAGIPLALDYATFQGTPALVVVLPDPKPDKVALFVVPAGCAQADGQVLYFTRLPKP